MYGNKFLVIVFKIKIKFLDFFPILKYNLESK